MRIPFDNLPANLDPLQFAILDSVRTNYLFVQESLNTLNSLAHGFSFLEDRKPSTHRLFLQAWSIIDATARIHKSINQFSDDIKGTLNRESLNGIKKAVQFRNTFQHLDERISEVFIQKEDTPLFGYLNWISRENQQNPYGRVWYLTTGYSTFRKQKIEYSIPATKSSKQINCLSLITFCKNGRSYEKDLLSFDELKLYIDQLIDDLQSMVNKNLKSSELKMTESTKDYTFVLNVTFEEEGKMKAHSFNSYKSNGLGQDEVEAI